MKWEIRNIFGLQYPWGRDHVRDLIIENTLIHKPPKFSHMINIHIALLICVLCKKISQQRITKCSWQNELVTHIIYFHYQDLKQLLWLSVHSVCYQHSAYTVSWSDMGETVFRLPLKYNCCKLQWLTWHAHLSQLGLKNTTEYTCLLHLLL